MSVRARTGQIHVDLRARKGLTGKKKVRRMLILLYAGTIVMFYRLLC